MEHHEPAREPEGTPSNGGTIWARVLGAKVKAKPGASDDPRPVESPAPDPPPVASNA